MTTPTSPLAAPAVPSAQTLTFCQARKIAKQHGHVTAPYRGYAHDLGNGTLLTCAPDGKFRIVPKPAL